jgi:hypothetical protein
MSVWFNRLASIHHVVRVDGEWPLYRELASAGRANVIGACVVVALVLFAPHLLLAARRAVPTSLKPIQSCGPLDILRSPSSRHPRIADMPQQLALRRATGAQRVLFLPVLPVTARGALAVHADADALEPRAARAVIRSSFGLVLPHARYSPVGGLQVADCGPRAALVLHSSEINAM